jgi:hypothetical protein
VPVMAHAVNVLFFGGICFTQSTAVQPSRLFA